MILVYCVLLADGITQTRVIEDIDYITLSRRCISYRLKNKEKWIHTLHYDSVSRIRLYEDISQCQEILKKLNLSKI